MTYIKVQENWLDHITWVKDGHSSSELTHWKMNKC